MIRAVVVASFLIVLCACAPRGETRSLQEVLEASQQRFAAAWEGELSSEARPILEGVKAQLSAAINASDPDVLAGISKDISQKLALLKPYAGYPTRPALIEIRSQYAQISQQPGGLEGGNSQQIQARVKLLVSRTYALLASELETTRFRL